MRKKARIFVGLFVGFVFLFAFALSLRVQAQSAESNWSAPVNLSQSGSAGEPQSIVSSDGTVHILWKDAFNGFTYMQGDGQNLSEPVSAEFPFGRTVILLNGNTTRTSYTPLLEADLNNRVHAFWTDNEDELLYSRVIADDFSTLTSWTAQLQLSEAALAVDVDVAINGLLHLAYVRPVSTAEFPSGVYYRNSSDGGATWSAPTLLYESPYFRGLAPQAARVELQVTDAGQVIVAWDNRPEERVFIIRSSDSGTTWEEVAEIDQRQNDDLDNAVGPANISVVDDGSNIHLFWQAGHEALLCAQYHQWSANGGQSWQPTRRILTEFEGCSQENDFIVVLDGLIMVSAFEAGVYTQYWDGSEWGQLQRHGILDGFSNPSTFRSVELGCRDFVVQNDQVYVVGCDTSDNDDIWRLSTDLSNLTQERAAANSVWTGEELVALREEDAQMTSPLMVGDADGRLHALWSQENPNNSTIYYAVSEGAGWSTPVDILASPGSNSISEDPAAVYHPDGQLMVVWDNGIGGEVYFSRVPTALAGSAAEWFEAEPLPSLRTTAGSPDIAVGADGRIFVVYALQLNEDRGIYLVNSEDNGDSWSNPILIFDAVEAGWDAIDSPRIAITGDGFLHVAWTQRTFPPANLPLSTAYAASTDGGRSWSENQDLPFADAPPVWSELTAADVQTLYRIWQEDVEDGSNYWSQISNDSGLNWEQPVRISDRNNPLGEAALAVDGGGRPNLIQLTGFSGLVESDESASPGIQHWTWSENGWLVNDGFATQSGTLDGVDGVAAVVAANGNLTVLYSGLRLNVETGRIQSGYLSSSRSLALDPDVPVVVPTITAATTITGSEGTVDGPILTPAPTIEPTPTVFFPADPDAGSGFSIPFLGSLGIIGAIIPIGLVIFAIVLVSARLVRRNQG
jgi:hypothetical protein